MINTSSIVNLLKPGLASIFGDYASYPSQWSEIYDVYSSDKAVEVDVEMKMLGLAQIRAEGAPTAIDNMQQQTITSYYHKYVALSFIITRQAIKDNLYKTKFPLMVKALKKSMAQTKETLAANVLNNGFDSAYTLGDGAPLFGPHPISTGPILNRPAVSTQLAEGSLESAVIAIRKFKDVAGLTIKTTPRKLVVSGDNEFNADRLLNSVFRTGTANNDISAVYNLSTIPEGAKVNQYITIPGFWMVMTDASEGFKHYEREPLETDVYTDFATDNVMAKALERYSFGVSNWRCAYASAPGAY
jgi:hypothetical protein